jgi:hypothetical protein
MQVGDLVRRDVWSGYYQLMEIYTNEYGAKRLSILNLATGTYLIDIRPSHVKVLTNESR